MAGSSLLSSHRYSSGSGEAGAGDEERTYRSSGSCDEREEALRLEVLGGASWVLRTDEREEALVSFGVLDELRGAGMRSAK
ncbi:MAG: hypothetical protein IT535_14150 [Bauldia sp.]|nr:hypothetical protein [Bauldia sp.]